MLCFVGLGLDLGLDLRLVGLNLTWNLGHKNSMNLVVVTLDWTRDMLLSLDCWGKSYNLG